MKQLLYTLIIMASMPILARAQATYPFGTILKNVYKDQSKSAINAVKSGQVFLETIKPDGTWGDIAYQDQSATSWKPAVHIDRVSELVQAFSADGSNYRKNEKLYQAIIKALSIWYEKDPKSTNWWHNEISIPQKLGVLLILMRYADQQLPEDLQNKLLDRMKRGNMVEKTGANKTDIATHYFYRALLTEDRELLNESLSEFFKPVSLVENEEGLQHDFSYLQHGQQLYIGGYGNVFLGGVIKIAGYVAGTPYAMQKEKMVLLSEFYRNTYLKTFRSRYVDFNIEGRGVSRPGNLRKTAEKYRLNAMKDIDAENTSIWENERLRVDSVGGFTIAPFHKHLWKGDYTLHVRPEYSFNVRISSKRSKRTEMGNNENLYGKYLPDGATNIQLNGPEYYNIMPVWEWDKIPGTTSPDHDEDLKMTVNWGELGQNEFAGGVSDGVYGATAYQLDYEGLKAKKAWFFFDKEIVALGADINSTIPQHITTTINQTWLEGNVLTSTASVKKGESVKIQNQSPSWVQHNGITYYFPTPSNVSVSTQPQSGSWNKINLAHSKDNITGNVFKLWIDHGVKPDTASYQYIVLPTAKNVKSFDPKSINIISNNINNQSVYHQQLKIFQGVFYKPSTIKSEDLEITVNKPCVLMYNVSDKKLFIADPLFIERTINLQLKNLKTGKAVNLDVALPDGPYTGSTKEVKVVF